MNRRLLRLIAAALLMQACTTDPFDEGNVPEITEGEDLIECCFEESETKVSLSTQNFPLWDAGDQISILSIGGKNKQFTLVSGEGTATASFRGILPSGNNYHAIYPYSNDVSVSAGVLSFKKSQTSSALAGSFAEGENVMVASFSSENQTLAFANVFGLLELNLSGTAVVSKITLTSNEGQDILWGDFSLSLDGNQGSDDQTVVGSNGNNVLHLIMPSPVQLGQTGKTFYFVLPAGSLSKGFVADIYDADGNLVCTRSTTADQSISRSKIKVMPIIEDVDRLTSVSVLPEPFSWVAYNNLARTGTEDLTVIDPQTSGYPAKRSDKYVGMFYFVWHDDWCDQGPYNNQAMLGEHNYEYSETLPYGPQTYPHYWGEPYLGYYRASDSWVIRKHAQMLVDAGVDFIALDVTNNVFYEPQVLNLCKVYKEMRDEGNKTPQITFMAYHSYPHLTAVEHLYSYFYAAHPEYADLWFKWEGKPLMLANKNDGAWAYASSPIMNYFTYRTAWFLWNTNTQTPSDFGDPWWIDGVDKWPWGCCYTADTPDDCLKAGKHNGINECTCVMPATHPISNLGRSYPVNQGIKYNSGKNSYEKHPEKGIYFKTQFRAAQKLDPQVLFFTGWNEWVAGNYDDYTELQFQYTGGQRATHIFVDQYNHEFSRDIEPVNGDFGDNYYYYLADFVRKFKGVDETPIYYKNRCVTIDGKFADWIKVESCYADDRGDIKWRGYDYNGGAGYPSKGLLPMNVNMTGRNDLRICKIANDGANLYFYVEADSDLKGCFDGVTGLNLYFKTSNSSPEWEGFNFRLEPANTGMANLYASKGGWDWRRISADIKLAVSGNAMEVAIPFDLIDLNNANALNIDFKWVDNVDLSQPDGIQRCMRDGDSAPNGRFRYRYVFNK